MAERKKTTFSMEELYESCDPGITCTEWAKRLGIAPSTLWRRLKSGESMEAIVWEHKRNTEK